MLDLVQRNGEVTIPFLLSSRGYGLLWNNPAIGRVELAGNGTRWVADSARQIDYWVTAGTPAEILRPVRRRHRARSPMLPEWASGFWQSKLRYRTQDELLAVAREYARRGLPLAVIVVDYFHWTHLGDWKFDPAEWPDPAALTAELRDMGDQAHGVGLAVGLPGQRELRPDARRRAAHRHRVRAAGPGDVAGQGGRGARGRRVLRRHEPASQEVRLG